MGFAMHGSTAETQRRAGVPRPRSDRRSFLCGIGASAALVSTGRIAAISPVVRDSTAPWKLSLAAYSLRDYLPQGGRGSARLDMLGFIDYCAKLGLDGAELTAYYLPDPCPAELLHQLKRRAHVQGIDISGGAIGNNFAVPTGTDQATQLEYTRRWIEAYARLGAPVIRVFAGSPPAGHEADAEKRIVDNMHAACQFAGTHGIMLALENHDYTTDIARCLRLIERIDSPWFGVNLDTGNLAGDTDPYEQIARLVPFAVNVQVKVSIPRAGVQEPADYARIVHILKDAGYRGYIVLEYEADDPYAHIPHHLEQLRNIMRTT